MDGGSLFLSSALFHQFCFANQPFFPCFFSFLAGGSKRLVLVSEDATYSPTNQHTQQMADFWRSIPRRYLSGLVQMERMQLIAKGRLTQRLLVLPVDDDHETRSDEENSNDDFDSGKDPRLPFDTAGMQGNLK